MAPRKENEFDVEEFTLSLSLLLRRIRAMTPPESRDFSLTQKAVLKRLEKDGPATSADLARAESVKPQSMGAAIAALEEVGFVERQAHPRDGRQVMIKLTTKGLNTLKGAREVRHAWLDEAVAKLTKSEQATLIRAGEIMKKVAEL